MLINKKIEMKTPKEWEQQIAWSKMMKEKREKLIEKAKKNKKKKE